MQVTLVGKQIVSYTKRQTGELKEGISVFYMAPKEGVQGQCTDSLWIAKGSQLYTAMEGLAISNPVRANVTYEMQPGSRYPSLTDIQVKQ